MLEQVAVLVGLDPDVTGSGTTTDPWVTPIATAGPVTLSLAAWNARTGTDPAGFERLRLGVTAVAADGVFAGRLLVELLAIDLPPTGSGSARLIGRSQLAIEITPAGPLDLSGLAITSGPAQALVSWTPGEPPVWQVGITGVSATVDAEVFGPFDVTLPGLQPDLGLGADALRVLGQLVGSAVRSWAGEQAYALAAVLGLHRDLPDLPDDWPLLSDVLTGPDGLQSFLADPAGSLRAYVNRVVTGISATGTTHAGAFLHTLGTLLPSDNPPGLGLPSLRAISGHGRYDDPWVIPIVDQSGDASRGATTVEGLVWLDPAGPPEEWIASIAQLADEVGDGVFLTSFLSAAGAFRPSLTSLLSGRNLDALAQGFDDLTDWIGSGDGLVPLASQLPPGWTHGTTVGTTHALLPSEPGGHRPAGRSSRRRCRAGVAGGAAVLRPHQLRRADHGAHRRRTRGRPALRPPGVARPRRRRPDPGGRERRGVHGRSARRPRGRRGRPTATRRRTDRRAHRAARPGARSLDRRRGGADARRRPSRADQRPHQPRHTPRRIRPPPARRGRRRRCRPGRRFGRRADRGHGARRHRLLAGRSARRHRRPVARRRDRAGLVRRRRRRSGRQRARVRDRVAAHGRPDRPAVRRDGHRVDGRRSAHPPRVRSAARAGDATRRPRPARARTDRARRDRARRSRAAPARGRRARAGAAGNGPVAEHADVSNRRLARRSRRAPRRSDRTTGAGDGGGRHGHAHGRGRRTRGAGHRPLAAARRRIGRRVPGAARDRARRRVVAGCPRCGARRALGSRGRPRCRGGARPARGRGRGVHHHRGASGLDPGG